MQLATIYRIVHTDSQRCYVGHSTHGLHRFRRHRQLLADGAHHSPYLQNAWTKYGQDAFAFELLEACPEGQKLLREQFYIDTLNSVFNYARVAGSRAGVPLSPSEVEALRQRMMGNQRSLGRKHPPDEIERRASFHRGRKRSDESRARMSAGMKGVSHGMGHEVTEATRQKISAANKGHRNTPEQEARRIASRRANSPVSQEDVEVIKASAEKGGVLAARYGISPALVSMIRTGKRRA